jgi:ectoine hydroxylase-related dioxygenase (phytanoyl-CoA dioxygenase family)
MLRSSLIRQMFGLIVVAFELFDTFENDGGFCCIAGSHKGNIELPQSWADLSQGVHPCITRVPARAGDAIIFTEALTHGTLPWTVDAPRQTVFYKFSPHGTTWSADYFSPEAFRHYSDIDDRKLAILEPPNARYWGRPTRPAR